MGIKISVTSYLQPFTANAETAEVSGSTVGECLAQLVQAFPALEKMLFDKKGRLHSYVGIYVNGEDAFPQDLAKAVKDGDELYIQYTISGG